jgi:predicted ATP-dependent endonuclease of OLD family
LASKLNKIQIEKQTDKVVRLMNKMEPAIRNLSLGNNGEIYCDVGLDRLMLINVMGDGVLQLLAVILVLSDLRNGVFLIDEIESGLHYSSQETMWDAVLESAKEFNVQVFATTHSFECIRALSASASRHDKNGEDISVFMIERKKDVFKAIRYGHQDIEAAIDAEWEVR